MQESLSLRDYPTLASVVGFVRTMRPRPEEICAEARLRIAEPPPLPPRQSEIGNPKSEIVQAIGTLEDADKMPRRVPVPSLRPALDLCKSTGVSLGEGSRVVVMLDHGGVGQNWWSVCTSSASRL